MGFSSPAALFALVAVALPVVAHLMRRRDLPERWLPTIELLKRAQVQSRRRLRLIDWLLLALRIAIVSALALAIAQPYVTVTLAYGDGSVTSTAIVVDDSMSMNRADEGSPLLESALDRADEVISSLPDGSEVGVILAGAPARTLVPRTKDLALARRTLRSVRPTARGTDMKGAVAAARRELVTAEHLRQRLLVLTDRARHANWGTVSWPPEARVDVERIGARPDPNRAITAATVEIDSSDPKRAKVRVEVRADRRFPRVTLRLTRQGVELDRKQAVVAEGRARLALEADFVATGDPTAEIALEGKDAIATDDRRAVLLRPPSSLRALLVDGDPHPSRDRNEVGYLSRALDAASTEPFSISYRVTDTDAFTSRPLAGYDVVVLANVSGVSEAAASRLVDFVKQGGGLLLAVGDRIETASLQATLREVLPGRMRGAVSLEPPLGLRPASKATLASPREWALDEVRTHRRVPLDDLDLAADVELTFDEGSPALVTKKVEAGRSAFFATTLDDGWSDLPLHPGFLPLMVRTITHLSHRTAIPSEPLTPGSQVALALPPGSDRIEVTDPEGTRHVHEKASPLTFVETETPGAYRVRVASGTSTPTDYPGAAFVIAPPASESELAVAPAITAGGQALEARTRTASRRSLAPWLFLVAALLALVEAIARGSRARGLTPSRTAA